MKSELDQWFARAILPHEGALTRYLMRAWPNAADVPDLRQDIYVRIYRSAAHERPAHPRGFLFTIARNLLTDRIRRGRVVSIDYTQDLDPLNVLVDEISPEHRLSARQDLRRLSDALDALPERTRDVIWLRRVEGLSQREACVRLGMKEGTLESHMGRGVRALAKAVFGGVSVNTAEGGETSSDEETEHG
jgi:RNA polymerase sigma factor (sigma-70 family)